jgi:hypothetical protein
MKPWLIILAATLAEGACGSSQHDAGNCGSAAYAPTIDPAQFTTAIDNQYFPLAPGTVFKYDGGTEQVEFTVTASTRTVMGVRCVVVHDVARLTATGQVLEDTYDWFAQDRTGNVWYFGEDTTAYPEGLPPVKDGSWEAGVGCGKPGIVMRASPKVGDSYRQEYLAGMAEDQADVISLDEKVTVPYGTFSGCLKTKDYTALEPGKAENKYYCPGVGQVLTVDIVTSGTPGREQLVSLTKVKP